MYVYLDFRYHEKIVPYHPYINLFLISQFQCIFPSPGLAYVASYLCHCDGAVFT